MRQKYVFYAFVILIVLFPRNTALHAQYDISFTTNPPYEQIAPDKDPVTFHFRVHDEQGKPLQNARIELVLNSPKPGKFFSTDFPWVENSTLFELQSTLKNGYFSFDYLIPIRGTYTLKANVLGYGSTAPMEKIFTFKVHENPDEMKKLYLLVALLFVVGFLAGMFFRRSREAVAAALFVAAFFSSPLQAHKVKHGAVKGGAKRSFAVKQAGRTLSVTLKPDHGVVGKITHIEAALTDSRGNNVNQPAYFAMKITNAEDNLRVLENVVYAPEGKTRQGIQTTDGANHTVTIQAYDKNPAEKNLRIKPVATFKKEIEVESFAPPKTIVARTLIFLLLILAFGIVAGSLVEGMRKIQ